MWAGEWMNEWMNRWMVHLEIYQEDNINHKPLSQLLSWHFHSCQQALLLWYFWLRVWITECHLPLKSGFGSISYRQCLCPSEIRSTEVWAEFCWVLVAMCKITGFRKKKKKGKKKGTPFQLITDFCPVVFSCFDRRFLNRCSDPWKPVTTQKRAPAEGQVVCWRDLGLGPDTWKWGEKRKKAPKPSAVEDTSMSQKPLHWKKKFLKQNCLKPGLFKVLHYGTSSIPPKLIHVVLLLIQVSLDIMHHLVFSSFCFSHSALMPPGGDPPWNTLSNIPMI